MSTNILNNYLQMNEESEEQSKASKIASESQKLVQNTGF